MCACKRGNALTDSKPDLADFYRPVIMEDMMDTVGVEPFDILDLDGGQSYLQARANCHACSCKANCSKWLAANSEGEPQSFCPNAELFKAAKS